MRRATRSAARASRTSAMSSSCEDASIERYLEAAKLVADHAVVGAGPLEFYADPGKTGLELSALEPHQRPLCDEGLSRRVGRRRTAVRARTVRQGLLRRVVLQAPRRARRSHRDDSRARGEGRHHRPLCRAHLDGGQQAEHRVSDARDGGRLDAAAGADLRRQGVAGQGPRRLRRALQGPDDLAELVFCSRRSGRRRRRRREPAGVRRHDAEGRADAPLHVCVGRSRRPRPRRARPRPVPRRCISPSPMSNPRRGRDAGGHLAQPARRDARAAAPGRGAPGRGVRGGAPRWHRPADAVSPARFSPRSPCAPRCRPTSPRTLAFGTSPDGTAIGPDDFATTGTVSFTIDVPRRRQRPGVSGGCRARQGQERRRARDDLRSRRKARRATRGQRVILGDPQERRLRDVSRQHGRIRVAPAAELARRGQSRGQGSGPAAIRQHLQQPRARCVRAEGEVPAQRQVLHRQHGGRRRSRAAESGVERPLRIVAVPRCLPRHAGRSLRA